MSVDHDRPGADEADAADYLRRDPAWVSMSVKAMPRDEKHQGRAKRNEEMGARPRDFAPPFALRANQPAQYPREHEPQHHFNGLVHMPTYRFLALRRNSPRTSSM